MNRPRMVRPTIRKAEQRDATALATCIDAAYADYAARIADLPPVSAGCAEAIARHHVWVAEIDIKLVGGLEMVPGDGFMRLANLAVHPDHEGVGLSRALLARAEAEASDQGYRKLRLPTHVGMPEKVRLYAHLGWQGGRRQGNEVSMKKAI